MDLTAEEQRLRDARTNPEWRLWGPYLSERQWGTVREDYSADGDAWDYFTHDQARSRAYRWGEDGLAGHLRRPAAAVLRARAVERQDPILKERLFGLTNAEGNHGEDVKEYYFYLDNVPTHSYQRWLYKYPQAAYPVRGPGASTNAAVRIEPEYELIDTGVFDDDRYFDVEVEYAKAAPDDVLFRITVANRGPGRAPTAPAADAVVPQHLVVAAEHREPRCGRVERPTPVGASRSTTRSAVHLHVRGPRRCCSARTRPTPSGCWGSANSTPFVKDGINDHVVGGRRPVNPDGDGTKVAAHVRFVVPGRRRRSPLRLPPRPRRRSRADPFGAASTRS